MSDALRSDVGTDVRKARYHFRIAEVQAVAAGIAGLYSPRDRTARKSRDAAVDPNFGSLIVFRRGHSDRLAAHHLRTKHAPHLKSHLAP